MNPRTLKIFKKKSEFHISIENIIALTLLAIALLMGYFEKYHSYDFGNWIAIISIVWLIYIVVLIISNFFRHEKTGKLIGNLILLEDKIILDNKSYSLSEIKKVEFKNTHDIKGIFTNSLMEFAPRLSNGLDNQIILNLNNGNIIKQNFLQTESNQIRFSKGLLIHYYNMKKIEMENLLSILKIHDYEDIKTFKRDLK